LPQRTNSNKQYTAVNKTHPRPQVKNFLDTYGVKEADRDKVGFDKRTRKFEDFREMSKLVFQVL